MKRQERIWPCGMEIAIKNYSVYKKLRKAIITSPATSRDQSLVSFRHSGYNNLFGKG